MGDNFCSPNIDDYLLDAVIGNQLVLKNGMAEDLERDGESIDTGKMLKYVLIVEKQLATVDRLWAAADIEVDGIPMEKQSEVYCDQSDF